MTTEICDTKTTESNPTVAIVALILSDCVENTNCTIQIYLS